MTRDTVTLARYRHGTRFALLIPTMTRDNYYVVKVNTAIPVSTATMLAVNRVRAEEEAMRFIKNETTIPKED